MKKYVFWVIMSMFICMSLSFNKIEAYVDNSFAIVPNIACDPDIGCIISESRVAKTTPVIYYSQKNSNWKDLRLSGLTGTESAKGQCWCAQTSTNKHCSIGSSGCALTSFSMILQTFNKNNQIVYNPAYVQSVFDPYHLEIDVSTPAPSANFSCSFSTTRYTRLFSNVVSNVENLQGPYTTKGAIYSSIKPYIDNGYLIIMYGWGYRVVNGVVTNEKTYHYAIINGYEKIDRITTTGEQHYLSIFIEDPSDINRTEIDDYMVYYTTVTNLYIFKKP